jgi:hypothetical protein
MMQKTKNLQKKTISFPKPKLASPPIREIMEASFNNTNISDEMDFSVSNIDIGDMPEGNPVELIK